MLKSATRYRNRTVTLTRTPAIVSSCVHFQNELASMPAQSIQTGKDKQHGQLYTSGV